MSDIDLLELARKLRLVGIPDTLLVRIEQARASSLSYEELIAMLLQDEDEARQQNMLAGRVKQARFEEPKNFDNFEMACYSTQVIQAVRALMTGKFIKEKNHIIIMGPVGTGKTHLAQALGFLACQRQKKVCFIRTNDLLNQFHQSRADETWASLFKRYTKYDVLILDDFGLKTLSPEQSVDLYDLIAAIHINSILIITTNRKIEGWMELFYDPVMANAALDRVVNKAYRIVLDGASYRKNFIPKFNKGDDK
ncbi:MAG: IS21-like element helper ATPase IstB [Shewanella sp.]